MKRYGSLILILALLGTAVFSMSSCSSEETGDADAKAGKYYYVSPTGSDEGDGSESAPFATIAGARDAIRALKAKSGLPDGGVRVNIAAGRYQITESIELTAEDGGEAGKPVIYAAAKGAEVVLDAGVTLNASDFKPVSDEIKERLQTEEAKANVLELDLAAAGCYDLDDTKDYSPGWVSNAYRQELYVGGERQTVARWPNGEYASSIVNRIEDTTVYLRIPEEKAKAWAGRKNIRYYGYPEIDWSAVFYCADNLVLPDTSEFALVGGSGRHNMDTPFFLFNILEELDAPGEYYWDVPAKKLYYYPKEALTDQTISFSQLGDNIFRLSGAGHVEFEHLTMVNARNDAIAMKSGESTEDVAVRDCTFRSLGANAVCLSGSRITVSGCEVCHTGAGGILVNGGDQRTQTLSNSVITNNYVHHWSETYTVYNPGICVDGIGFEISHNELHDSPHEAIAFNCGQSVIEYNLIYDVCTETSDAGAIYSGRRWDWRDNIIRYNYIHDVIDHRHGGTPNGIYLDDQLSGQTCYGNVLVNIAGNAFALGGGKDTVVENNIIIGTGGVPVSVDERGLGWQTGMIGYQKPEQAVMWSFLERWGYSDALMRYRFPQNMLLSEVGDSKAENVDDPGTPSYMVIRGNIAYQCKGNLVIADAEGADKYKDSISTDGVALLAPASRSYGTIAENVRYDADPGFIDPQNGNYFLREDSRVYRDILNFGIIPVNEIGRYNFEEESK